MLTLDSILAAQRLATAHGIGKHRFGYGFEEGPKLPSATTTPPKTEEQVEKAEFDGER